jgi:hypothetical protein
VHVFKTQAGARRQAFAGSVVCLQVRSHAETSHIKVIVFSIRPRLAQEIGAFRGTELRLFQEQVAPFDVQTDDELPLFGAE